VFHQAEGAKQPVYLGSVKTDSKGCSTAGFPAESDGYRSVVWSAPSSYVSAFTPDNFADVR
jgi:hypothetical protein